MKTIIAIMALASLALSSVAEKNLIENGDFSQGSKKWKGAPHNEHVKKWQGKKNIEFETPTSTNQVCKIELDETYSIAFYQKIKTRGLDRLIVKCRYKKSKDWDAGTRYLPVDFTFITPGDKWAKQKSRGFMEVENRGIWSNTEETFILDGEFSSGELHIEVHPGYSGYVMIDDISVTGE